MRVGDIGEFDLIGRLDAVLSVENERRVEGLRAHGLHIMRGIGDDAAAWRSEGGVRVLTTDTMVEGVHFDLAYTDWGDLGWKSIATNVSDVAAMGCVPTCAVVTLGLRPDLPVDGLEAMYEGMMRFADLCHPEIPGLVIVGGDVVKSPVFFVSVTLEGAASSDGTLMTRDAAQPGDIVCLTGSVGASGAGLRLLQGANAQCAVDPERAAYLRLAHSRPAPCVAAGISLATAGVRCAMDVSDGLLDDLNKLCRAAGVGARIRMQDIPVDRRLAAAFPDDCLQFALNGGEDYVILFTAPSAILDELKRHGGLTTHAIGEVVASEPCVDVLDDAGNPIDLEAGGWDHFRSE